MPIYTCSAPSGELTGEQKAAIAAEITRIHCEVTGAPAAFVHVFFHDLAPGNAFISGRPFDGRAAVVGLIRAGRSDEDKARILFGISAAWHAVTGLDEKKIVVGVEDVPAKNIVEDGALLPEPGEEEAWLAAHGLEPVL